jgi:hypothetical protein
MYLKSTDFILFDRKATAASFHNDGLSFYCSTYPGERPYFSNFESKSFNLSSSLTKLEYVDVHSDLSFNKLVINITWRSVKRGEVSAIAHPPLPFAKAEAQSMVAEGRAIASPKLYFNPTIAIVRVQGVGFARVGLWLGRSHYLDLRAIAFNFGVYLHL